MKQCRGRTLSVSRTVLLLLTLTACSGLPLQQAATFPPLAPATLGTPRSTLQLLHGAFGDRELAFQCVVEATPRQLTLVGLGAQGQRWFSLRHDGTSLAVETSPLAPAALEPRRVLADLQLLLWPLTALQQAFVGTRWQVSEPVAATRRLWRNGRLIAEVHYTGADPWQGHAWLSNFEFGYSLAVESQPLP